MKTLPRLSFVSAALCLALAACGNNSSPADGGNNGGGAGGGTAGGSAGGTAGGSGGGTAGGSGGGTAGGSGGGTAGGSGGGTAGGSGGGTAGGSGGGTAGGSGGGSGGGTAQAPGQTLADGGTCTANADYGAVDGGFGQSATYTQSDDMGVQDYEYDVFLNADPLPDVFDIQIYANPDGGVFQHGFDAGTYTLAGDDLQFQNCDLCLLVYTDNDANANPTDTYMATGGTITFTTFQPTLAGTVTNATFAHVNIDENNVSTPINDGCDAKIDSVQFSVTVNTGGFRSPGGAKPPARKK